MLVSHLVEISWKNTRLPKGFESHVDVLTAAEIAVDTGLLQMRWKAPEARLCWWKESCTFPFTSRLPMKNLGLSNWLNLFRSHAPAKGLLIMNEFMFPAVRTPADDGKKEVTKLLAVGAADTGCLLNTTLVASQKNGWRNPQDMVSPTYTFPHRSSAPRPQPELQEHRDAFIHAPAMNQALSQVTISLTALQRGEWITCNTTQQPQAGLAHLHAQGMPRTVWKAWARQGPNRCCCHVWISTDVEQSQRQKPQLWHQHHIATESTVQNTRDWNLQQHSLPCIYCLVLAAVNTSDAPLLAEHNTVPNAEFHRLISTSACVKRF